VYYNVSYNSGIVKPALVQIPFSKSIINRLLIIDFLANGQKINIEKWQPHCIASDTNVLLMALSSIERNEVNIDAANAGTAYRFLTSLIALLPTTRWLTGSADMETRPIAPLVNALGQLGALIHFIKQINFPPLKIEGGHLINHKANISGSISSQFISSLMLIGNQLPTGLQIALTDKLVSNSYIDTTIEVLNYYGVQAEQTQNGWNIPPIPYQVRSLNLPIDCSCLSFLYQLAMLSTQFEIMVENRSNYFWQGDIAIIEIAARFGVNTIIEEHQIIIKKVFQYQAMDVAIEFDLKKTPDLAQPLMATMLALKQNAIFKGIGHLKYKETNRILAMQTELKKMGGQLIETENNDNYFLETKMFELKPTTIATYNDHRMAMSFACMAILGVAINIENPVVVNKSFPNFWNIVKQIGFNVNELDISLA
jgi:3-phosphoshikimate 1-carboxyvinyltransferase